MDGVYSTRSAWAGHHEVVHVTYDPATIEYSQLLAGAKRMRCTSAVYTYDDAQLKIAEAAGVSNIIPWKPSLETRQVRKSEQKYHLRNTPLVQLPLNELQAVKLNVLASRGRGQQTELAKILSPRQIALMKRISTATSKNPSLLAGISFPEDQSDLAAYSDKLLDRLETAEK